MRSRATLAEAFFEGLFEDVRPDIVMGLARREESFLGRVQATEFFPLFFFLF